MKRAIKQISIKVSGRQDLNLRPFAPKANALPGCATPRKKYFNVVLYKKPDIV